VTQALLPTPVKNLALVPAGPAAPNPSELLMTPLMSEIIRAASRTADYVLFDSPPVLAVTDATVLAGRTDAVVLVVEAKKTRSDAVKQAYEAVAKAGTRCLGVVLNKTAKAPGYYGYRHVEPTVAQEPPTWATTHREQGAAKSSVVTRP
jgi:capsular exopolysaccharide synthesis family protein